MSDSLGLGSIAAFLGLSAPDSVQTDYGGTLVERVNYLEKQNKMLAEGLKDLATKEDVENASKEANASHNLYVYIPKDVATGNYDGKKVTITSASGNQNSAAILRDDGTNYSATLYFNFSGNCKLSYDILSTGQAAKFSLGATINATGQEQKLIWVVPSKSLDFVHAVCDVGVADQFFSAGDVLENGWTVVNAQAAALQIWRKTNLEYGDWHYVNAIAVDYWKTFNKENNTNVAYTSGLLGNDELMSGWLASNRMTSFSYWTSTEYSSGINHHYCLVSDMLTGQLNDNTCGCLPYVMIK